MGTDNLFHKRKAKGPAELSRRQPQCASYDKVLIVCEGEKTEPFYFRELIDYYEIHSANVRISGDCGSDPVSVVEHGLALYHAEKSSTSGAFDRVYCVFDRDSHPNYLQAVDKVSGAKPKGVFFAATSVPCFEYWLFLHFSFTTAPYSAAGGVSAGAAVLKALKAVWPEYTKVSQGVFISRLGQLEYAKANAARALEEAKKNHTDNPTTHIHEMVGYLQNIKRCGAE
jgi:hypothetical protein